MNKLLPSIGLIASLILSQYAAALTFKTGEVIGPDGKSYAGMSPQNKANLLAHTKPGEIKTGLQGSSFYLVYNNTVVIVPVADLVKKTHEERMVVIGKAIRENNSLRHVQPTQTQTISNLPTPPTGENELNDNHMANNAESSILGIGPYSMDQSNSDATISMGNDLEHELEMSLGGDLEHELEMALGGDLEHELEMALGGDLMNAINDHLEEGGGFDHVDSSDHNDSEEGAVPPADDLHENADDHME